MSRSGETEYDSEVDIEGLLADEPAADRRESDDGERREATGERTREAAKQSDGAGLRARLPAPSFPSPSLPSPALPRFTLRGLGLSLVVCVGAFLAAGFTVPLGGVAGLVGVFAGAFALGLLGRGHYLELAVAGAGTAAVGTLVSQLFIAAVADLAVPLAAVGGTAGLLAAVTGCYFGRDLRDGLTRGV